LLVKAVVSAKPTRSVGLVEESADGDLTHRAEVVAYSFDDLIFAFDRDDGRVPIADREDLVALAAAKTGSVHRGIDTRVQHSGNGYRVQVPAPERALAPARGSRVTPRPACWSWPRSTRRSARVSYWRRVGRRHLWTMASEYDALLDLIAAPGCLPHRTRYSSRGRRDRRAAPDYWLIVDRISRAGTPRRRRGRRVRADCGPY